MPQPYQRFARHYHEGHYTQFARWVSETVFPHFQQVLSFQPQSLLDLACGTGIFACHMAAKGLRVTGLDISPQMLEIARESARENGVSVSWVQADMSRLKLAERFDCVTCFFDSLNYLLKAEELARAFQAVSAHLNPGGWFIFDMNTIYGLAVSWQRFPYNLIEDTADYLELMGTSYDYELNIADVRFIMFEREGDYTELLMPTGLLSADSVRGRAVAVLTEEVCDDVEVIGWLYQFYISERKDEVFDGFKKNKKAGAAEIPAATQLLSPRNYMNNGTTAAAVAYDCSGVYVETDY